MVAVTLLLTRVGHIFETQILRDSQKNKLSSFTYSALNRQQMTECHKYIKIKIRMRNWD